jgi:hypothetical protein
MRATRKGTALMGLATLAALGLGGVRPVQAQVTIINPSFEADPVPSYPGYTTAITGWTSSNSMNYANGTNNNGAGLNSAGGPFANNGAIPDGSQVAFLQAQAATLSRRPMPNNSPYPSNRPGKLRGGFLSSVTFCVTPPNNEQ